ncbi:MAG: hypothetical protein GY828_00820 [Candidatus Gracilibacteria bacterium]|nr:hypothetical protein [Candidatus Gracilibacteria bacterium]
MGKKFCVLMVCLFTLVSCGEEVSTTEVETKGLTVHNADNFMISVPSNWEVLNGKENILPQPSQGNIELSVQSPEPKGGFSNNLLIMSDKLHSFSTSAEYSMANNIGARRDYLDYTLLDNKEFEFTNGEKSQLYTFEAKYNYDTPKLKFLQTAYVCQPDTAYFLTIAVGASVLKTDKYETLLSTFSCKHDEKIEEL